MADQGWFVPCVGWTPAGLVPISGAPSRAGPAPR
jgi:hypothetical protein